MSKLDELIKELCPDGVEYKAIEEVAEYRRGSFPQPYTNPNWYGGIDSAPFVQVADIKDDFFELKEKTKQTISKIAQPNSVFVRKGTVLITIQGTIGRVAITQYDAYVDRTIAIFTNYLIPINKKYFCYVAKQKFDIEKKYARGTTLKTITKEDFSKYKIPVPPLPVQDEIVRILDTFTSLTAELTAELTARRKQYEYSRDSLLTRDTKVERFKIKDLFDTRNGYTPSTSNSDFWDNGTVPWFVMEDIRENGRVLSDSKQHITESAVKKSGLFPANSIIVATSATIGEHALITSDFLCNQRFTCLSPKTEYKSKIDMKYMFYYAFKLDEFCKRNTTKSSFASVDMGKFYDFEFPLPSLDVQQRIVNVLDNFDSICTDLKIGIPAEIEARKKQYEYYRDLLLTFASSGNTILSEQNRTEQNRTEQNRTEQNR